MAMRQLVKEGVKGKFVHLPVCWEKRGGGWQSHCPMLRLGFSVLMVLGGFRVGDASAKGPESNLMTVVMCALIDVCDFYGPWTWRW